MLTQPRFNLVAGAITLALSAPVIADENTSETLTIIGDKKAAQSTAGLLM